MTIHLGNVPAGTVLYIPFATYNAAGASVTMTGFAVGDIKIYKDGGTTERASTAGFTLLDTDGTDFDGVTGLQGFSVDLSDNTTAGFYAVGSFYWVVVSVVTIDSQTVTLIAATFRIRAAEDTAGYEKVTIKSGTGTGELSIASGVVQADAAKVAGATPQTATDVATAVGAHAPESGMTIDHALQAILCAVALKKSGMAGTTGVGRDVADTKNRATWTMDASGNISAVTFSFD